MKKGALHRYTAAWLILAFLLLLFPSSSLAADAHILFIAPVAGNAKINGSADYYDVEAFDYASYATKTYAALTSASPTVITYDSSPLKQEVLGTVSSTPMYYFQVSVYQANFDAAYASFGTAYNDLAGVMINDVSAFDGSGVFVPTTDVFSGDHYRYFNDFSGVTPDKPTILQFIAPATINLHFIKDRSATPLYLSFRVENFSAPGTTDFSETSGIVFTVTNLGAVPAFLPLTYDYTELNSLVDFFLANYTEADYVNNSVKSEFESLLRQAANMKAHRNATAESAVAALMAALDEKACDLTPVSSSPINYATLQAVIDSYNADSYVNNAKKLVYENLLLSAINLISTSGAKNQLTVDIYLRRLNSALSQLTPLFPSGVDLTQLKAELAKAQYKNYQSANYMNNQYSNRTQFEATLTRAKAVTDAVSPATTTPEEVAQLLAALPVQFASLIDQTALRTAVETTYKDFNKDLFVDNDARAAFIAALTAARNMYTKATAMNQNEVNSLVSGLASLYAALTADSTAISLKDSATGVQVTGKLNAQAKLTVVVNSLHAANSCAACDEIRGLLNNNNILALYDISLSTNFDGSITVTLPVGTQYNGKTVSVLHCKNGKLEIQNATVTNGAASGSFGSLSPFAVVPGAYTSSKGGNILPPIVGDAPYSQGWQLLLIAAVLIMAMHDIRKKQVLQMPKQPKARL